LGRMGRRR